jgi:N-acetyl-anhydromuramyl-L-alanine amidase AmpD
LLSVKSKLLPAYCKSGRGIAEVGGVVIHFFSCKNVAPDLQFDMTACRNLFLDLNRPRRLREFYMKESQWPEDRLYASAHLLIGRDGETWRLAESSEQTYHAGASRMDGRDNLNAWTLGVELIGTDTSGFTRPQYSALAAFLSESRAKHGFSRANVQGHDMVRYAANMAGAGKPPKVDPSGQADGLGTNFDWELLRELWKD